VVARRPNFEAPDAPADATPATARSTRLIWAALAAIPVGLVIAVTSFITTDVASAPFLWLIFYSAESQVIEWTWKSALETRLGTTFPVID
jgi:hypothetical protein